MGWCIEKSWCDGVVLVMALVVVVSFNKRLWEHGCWSGRSQQSWMMSKRKVSRGLICVSACLSLVVKELCYQVSWVMAGHDVVGAMIANGKCKGCLQVCNCKAGSEARVKLGSQS